jgi:hypothetical protein
MPAILGPDLGDPSGPGRRDLRVSAIAGALSDCICQLAFGGGVASRTLFTNDERTVIYAQRPVVLVRINDFVAPQLRLHGLSINLERRRCERIVPLNAEAAAKRQPSTGADPSCDVAVVSVKPIGSGAQP